jgi:hypothetical protein
MASAGTRRKTGRPIDRADDDEPTLAQRIDMYERVVAFWAGGSDAASKKCAKRARETLEQLKRLASQD